MLPNRQHAVECDARPVFLIVRDDDAVMDASLNQLFKNPEQVIRRHAEHRRAETAELIEGRVHNRIVVPDQQKHWNRVALDRMLSIH